MWNSKHYQSRDFKCIATKTGNNFAESMNIYVLKNGKKLRSYLKKILSEKNPEINQLKHYQN